MDVARTPSGHRFHSVTGGLNAFRLLVTDSAPRPSSEGRAGVHASGSVDWRRPAALDEPIEQRDTAPDGMVVTARRGCKRTTKVEGGAARQLHVAQRDN